MLHGCHRCVAFCIRTCSPCVYTWRCSMMCAANANIRVVNSSPAAMRHRVCANGWNVFSRLEHRVFDGKFSTCNLATNWRTLLSRSCAPASHERCTRGSFSFSSALAAVAAIVASTSAVVDANLLSYALREYTYNTLTSLCLVLSCCLLDWTNVVYDGIIIIIVVVVFILSIYFFFFFFFIAVIHICWFVRFVCAWLMFLLPPLPSSSQTLCCSRFVYMDSTVVFSRWSLACRCRSAGTLCARFASVWHHDASLCRG